MSITFSTQNIFHVEYITAAINTVRRELVILSYKSYSYLYRGGSRNSLRGGGVLGRNSSRGGGGGVGSRSAGIFIYWQAKKTTLRGGG